MSTQLL